MSRAQWTWQLRGTDGVQLDRPLSPVFTSRFDAEAWLGEHRQRLAGEHVTEAQLQSGELAVGIVVTLHGA